MGFELGPDDYRQGALSRLEDAQALEERRRWVGAVYLAGRAVESILRGLLAAKSKEQQIGHDLRFLVKRVRRAGMLSASEEAILSDSLNEVAVVWHNNLRFAGTQKFLRRLKLAKRDRGIKGDAVEYNARRVIQASEMIVARGDLAWRRWKQN